jgi:hypothetical protein
MAALALFAAVSFGQQGRGSLRGVVADEFGASIVGATVTLMDATGTAKTATTNNEGVYSFTNLAPGKYTVVAVATGFALTEGAEIDIAAGQRQSLNLALKVTIEQQQVTVAAEQPISTEPTNNANQQVLTGKDLDALPDDPDELAAALQALAGPSMGPNGGTITIDGFGGGRMPPKESIREIRINQNPFAAENDRPSGGINILTKPGTDKFRGSGFFNFQDESLNSRNPFATNSPKRAPYQVRQFGGNLSGPIIKNKASFFFDIERRETNDNELIRATILDSGLNIVPFGLGVVVPRRVITFSPRFDYALNDKNTLIARYSFNHSTTANDGVGNFSLPERAYNSNFTQHQIQLTETAVLSPTVINETRFQFVSQHNESLGNNTLPTLNVSSAFIGGGSQVGHLQNDEKRWELQNFTQWQKGSHNIKFGGRIRGVNITNINPSSFGGSYSFNGGLVPLLNANDNLVLDGSGKPIPVQVTSIERYRRTVKFQSLGLSGQVIHSLGGGASQFNINAGNPEASVSQTDIGVYGQDDWRIKPNFTLSLGLRYEGQTNIGSDFNFAPRVAVSWSPGAGNSAKPPKTVVRAGVGVFYNRFGENFTLTANRFNGVNQQTFQLSEQRLFLTIQPGQPGCPASATTACLVYQNPVANPFLDSPSSVIPPVSALVAAGRVLTYRVSPDLQAPTLYLMGSQIEHQLPYRITMFVGVFSINIQHVIRARDINAPLPGTITSTAQFGVRPNPALGDIYQFESSGRFRQSQFFIGFNNRLNPAISLNGNYVYSRTSNDTDGGGGFPANSYDLTGEYGRGTGDVRHRFTINGTINVPWGKFTLNPFVIASSGAPFNIFTGLDSNLDGQLTERPSFAAANAVCGLNIRCTSFGNFNLSPLPGEQIIPRNYGQGPGFLSVNMRVSRTWAFGDVHRAGSAAAGSGQGANRRGAGTTGGGGGGAARGGGGGAGGPGGMAGMGGMAQRGGGGIPGLGPGGLGGGGASAEKKYSLTLSLNFQNLLNNVNFNSPNGNLSSTTFGQSLGLNGGFGGFGPGGGGGGGGGGAGAGNRKVTAQIRFTF